MLKNLTLRNFKIDLLHFSSLILKVVKVLAQNKINKDSCKLRYTQSSTGTLQQ